jgi:hypothetical protein
MRPPLTVLAGRLKGCRIDAMETAFAATWRTLLVMPQTKAQHDKNRKQHIPIITTRYLHIRNNANRTHRQRYISLISEKKTHKQLKIMQ